MDMYLWINVKYDSKLSLYFFQKLSLGWVFRPEPVKNQPKPKILGLAGF